MKKLDPTMAQQVAQAIRVFQEQRTGYPPEAVTVVRAGHDGEGRDEPCPNDPVL